MHSAYLSLGSNLGDRAKNLEEALSRLQSPRLRLVSVSSLYETEPVRETATTVPRYLNLAAKVETDLSPKVLLEHLQDVERRGGRTRTIKWGARTIDIDILLYDDQRVETEALSIPHPHMLERAFVLVPLAEIASDLVLPDGTTITKRLNSPAIRMQIENGDVKIAGTTSTYEFDNT